MRFFDILCVTVCSIYTAYFDHPDLQGLISITTEYEVATADGSDQSNLKALSNLLHRIRLTFGMDCVFVSEFVEGRRVFRHVDCTDKETSMVKMGGSDSLEDTYCQRIVDGRLPLAISDTAANNEANSLPITKALEIGAYLSAPIVLASGDIFGTLCCFSKNTMPGLGGVAVDALAAIAKLISSSIRGKKESFI